MKRALVIAAVAACSSPAPRVEEAEPVKNVDPPADAAAPRAEERRATIAIDAQPGGKKFQGVWLEQGEQRWVIDYRPRAVWRPFEGAEVLVTGHCYQPFGQAINAVHFEVETLRLADERRGGRALRSVGPLTWLTGRFRESTAPEGSKAAGSVTLMFDADADGGGGTPYVVYGEAPRATAGDRVKVQGRAVEVDLAYAATAGGPHLWVSRVEAVEYEPDPAYANTPKPCP